MPFRSEPLGRHWFEPNGVRAGNGDCQMRFTGSGAADQHDITLIGDEGAGGKVADQARIYWRIGEVEVVQILRQRQLCDGQLVSDRPGLLLGNLGLQQIADDAWRFVLAFDAGGHDLVISAAHPVKLQGAHQVEDLGAFHRCLPS